MIVSDLMERINGGETIKEISQIIGLNPSTIQRRLKKMGYAYNNSSKRWEWIGEEEEPLGVDISRDVNPSPPKVISGQEGKIKTKEECEKKVKSNSLSFDEIQDIREMITDWKNKRLSVQVDNIYERVRSLEQEDKTRKTIVITKTVAKDFDLLAKKHRKIDKSDLIHLALIDFMEKYT